MTSSASSSQAAPEAVLPADGPVAIRADAPLLILNGAEERIQIVIGRETLLSSRELRVPGQALRHLAPALRDMLAEQELAPEALGGVACVRGPGSFTGLRMVLSTAMGLALACDLPLAGLDYLPILAREALAISPLPVWVVTHSRREQVYAQGFVRAGETAEPLGPPRILALEEAAGLMLSGGDFLALGTGLRRNHAFFAERLPAASVLDAAWDNPRPDALLAVARRAPYAKAPVEPLYLRGSDAEENLTSIAALRGLGPTEAADRLRRAMEQPGASCRR